MPKRDLIIPLDDIEKMIALKEEMQKEIVSLEHFLRSNAFQPAFERGFDVMGEALYQIRKDFNPGGMKNIDKIISLRHLLAHDYFKVDHA